MRRGAQRGGRMPEVRLPQEEVTVTPVKQPPRSISGRHSPRISYMTVESRFSGPDLFIRVRYCEKQWEVMPEAERINLQGLTCDTLLRLASLKTRTQPSPYYMIAVTGPTDARPAAHNIRVPLRVWGRVRRGSGRSICNAPRRGARSVPHGHCRQTDPIFFLGWYHCSSPTGDVGALQIHL